jgi:hypothetical protein
MKISNLFHLSALIPLFALISAVMPPDDTSARMTHLRFQPVPDQIGNAGETKSLFLITTRAQYEQLFGEQRSISVDFNNEWAFFYSAGWMPSTGYEALVLDVGYRADVRTMVFTTQLVSPGRNCVQAPMLNKPYSLVKFPRPPGRVDFVRFMSDDIFVDCGR